jgi:hypothetical protein
MDDAHDADAGGLDELLAGIDQSDATEEGHEAEADANAETTEAEEGSEAEGDKPEGDEPDEDEDEANSRERSPRAPSAHVVGSSASRRN